MVIPRPAAGQTESASATHGPDRGRGVACVSGNRSNQFATSGGIE
jgi:hypothetical protein